MRIAIQLEAHAYRKEKLCDEYVDESLGEDRQSCGIADADVVIALRKNGRVCLEYEYNDSTTLQDVEDIVCQTVGIPNGEVSFAFLSGNVRYWIDDGTALFAFAVKNHLDPLGTGLIRVGLYVSMDAGAICEEDGIRYYMNSRERGRHHEAHVHLMDINHGHSAVMIIKDGRLVGDFPSKLTKKARKKILDNQVFFLEKWNALTDGLKVDINRFLGLIHY